MPTIPLRTALVFALLALGAAGCGPSEPVADDGADGEIPITAANEEARAAFVEARGLAESLRQDEARAAYERALELDPDLALAHLGRWRLAPGFQDSFDALERAVILADRVSPGERLLIEAAAAGAAGDPETQEELLLQLVEAYPEAARAHHRLAVFYLDHEDWAGAIRHATRATELDPEFAPAWNELGYARRFAGRAQEAEEAFLGYRRRIPDEPNPYDSHGELLLELGRFEEAAESYRTALAKDPGFGFARIGLAASFLFRGEAERARTELDALAAAADGPEERDSALYWTVASYLWEGRHADALMTAQQLYDAAAERDDRPAMAAYQVLMGDILLDAGTIPEAREHYRMAGEVIDRAQMPAGARDAARRDLLYREARAALTGGDLEAAEAAIATYAGALGEVASDGEERRRHELLGSLALARGDAEAALEHLEQAGERNPRVLLLTARACRGVGDLERAQRLAHAAASFNGLDLRFALIHDEAEALAAELASA